MATIKLKNVIKKFNEIETIYGVNLDLEDGEFVVFVGPSGCGKSTLLRLIAGLEDITDGTLEINGINMNNVAPADRGVAMVFQSYALYPHMTVEENMSFGLRMNGVAPEQIKEQVSNAANILQLNELLDRKPKQLSGGQRQRVAIGRAIVRQPEVFLFDEPLSNLDAELRVDMRIQIAKLHNRLKASMVYVTHDQVEAMTLADKIVVLRDGRIEQVGSPLELYHNPANEFVAGFIGSPKMNFIEGKIIDIDHQNLAVIEIHGERIELQLNGESVSQNEIVKLGIRPEHVKENLKEADITLPIMIDVAEHLGGLTYLYGQFENHTLTIEVSGSNLTRHGESIKVGIKKEDVYLFNKDGTGLVNRPLPTR
ncbi:ABC transporter ATP-binding protein [Marinomonas colpomeniae]|uniref:Sn-glycerol-3-phosphate ABC transporter ATP-binding protein UgpC n=1 Tax=Marinomonas colpomeniae TaxID=2774408 RepID=A0ABR8P2F9_9GAMM|nr:sn-glycerol-3-phosphate ABC transporter ATP-binding protein UgpC [Marinomonas colpomeniae]MBD5771984.1 sn-glycerol-3-phosphate ABC transporter ATP-binding protein UgpC [Marinomonas colpomeniae]